MSNADTSLKSGQRHTGPELRMVGRFTDGYECAVIGTDEEDCLKKLKELQRYHERLYWHNTVTDK